MSRGVNDCEETRGMFGFASEAEKHANQARFGGPCLFLSHRSGNKDAARAIVESITASLRELAECQE
jgi:hypothetical protein